MLSLLNHYAVDVPYWDEWSLIPGVDRDFPLDWFFGRHNEHRLALTRLLAWLQYPIDGLNFRNTILFNFIVYLFYVFMLWKHCLTSTWGRIILPFFAWSTLPTENVTWGFQNCYIFFVFCFVLAFLLSRTNGFTRQTYLKWLAPVVAVMGIYSFAAGVVCAASLVVLWLWEGYRDPKERSRFWVSAIITAIGIATWLPGYKSVDQHPDKVYFWHLKFWDYYLNIISNSFGYDHSENIIPGLVVVVLFVFGTWKFILPQWRDKISGFGFWVTLTGLAALALVSLGRAGLNVDQSKSSRYTTIGLLAIPFVLNATDSLIQEYAKTKKSRRILYIALSATFLIPLIDNFNLRSQYRSTFNSRKSGLECINRYYQSHTDGFCPMLYPIAIPSMFEVVRTKHINFTKTPIVPNAVAPSPR